MKKGKTTITGLGAALLAVLGSITCCGAPIAAGILASLGIGASQLSFLQSIQPYLIAIALFSLAMGFYRLYFKKNDSCCGTNPEGSIAPSKRKSKIFLWIVTIFTLGMLIYTNNSLSSNSENSCCPGTAPTEESCCTSAKEETKNDCNSCSSNTAAKPKQTSELKFKTFTNQSCTSCSAPSPKLSTVYFKVKGLENQCCIKPFITKLKNESGIKQFSIASNKKMIGLKFNEKEITLEQVKQLISKEGYEITQV